MENNSQTEIRQFTKAKAKLCMHKQREKKVYSLLPISKECSATSGK